MKREYKLKFLIISFIILFCLAGSLAQATININLNVQPSFSLGEELKFDYTIFSNTDEEINYFSSIECEKIGSEVLDLQTIYLKAGESYKSTYNRGAVSSDIESQNCEARISIIKPNELIKRAGFKITTEPSFELKVFTCKDTLCSEKSKIFLLNEEIYLDYTSSVQNPLIKAILIYPDKTKSQLAIPGSIKASEIGNYEIELTAQKEGYKELISIEQFGVIKKDAEIKSESNCNANNNCEENEDYQSCPQDCLESKRLEDIENWLQLLIFGIIILGAVIITELINRKIFKRRK